jgi:hypothetical protein
LQKNIDGNKRPAETDKVNYGGYLVTMAGSADCRTPVVQGQPNFANMFSAGNKFTIAGFTVTSGNIPPDSATGIGNWNEDAFTRNLVCAAPTRDIILTGANKTP